MGIGYTTAGTGHVHGLDIAADDRQIGQHTADAAAGEVPATARVGRCDT